MHWNENYIFSINTCMISQSEARLAHPEPEAKLPILKCRFDEIAD